MAYWLKINYKDQTLYIKLDSIIQITDTPNEIEITLSDNSAMSFNKSKIKTFTILNEQAMLMELPYLLSNESEKGE